MHWLMKFSTEKLTVFFNLFWFKKSSFWQNHELLSRQSLYVTSDIFSQNFLFCAFSATFVFAFFMRLICLNYILMRKFITFYHNVYEHFNFNFYTMPQRNFKVCRWNFVLSNIVLVEHKAAMICDSAQKWWVKPLKTNQNSRTSVCKLIFAEYEIESCCEICGSLIVQKGNFWSFEVRNSSFVTEATKFSPLTVIALTAIQTSQQNYSKLLKLHVMLLKVKTKKFLLSRYHYEHVLKMNGSIKSAQHQVHLMHKVQTSKLINVKFHVIFPEKLQLVKLQ